MAGRLPLLLLTARTQRLLSTSTAGLDLDAARLFHVGPLPATSPVMRNPAVSSVTARRRIVSAWRAT